VPEGRQLAGPGFAMPATATDLRRASRVFEGSGEIGDQVFRIFDAD